MLPTLVDELFLFLIMSPQTLTTASSATDFDLGQILELEQFQQTFDCHLKISVNGLPLKLHGELLIILAQTFSVDHHRTEL